MKYSGIDCSVGTRVLEIVCPFNIKPINQGSHAVQMREQAIAEATALRPFSAGRAGTFPEGSVIDESDYGDYARYYDEYDDDEEVEDYYFSAAAGRARVVLGNRRHGPNGFISSGRLQARPAPTPPPSKVRLDHIAPSVMHVRGLLRTIKQEFLAQRALVDLVDLHSLCQLQG